MGLETDFGEALIQPFITRTFSTPDLTALRGNAVLLKEGSNRGRFSVSSLMSWVNVVVVST